MKIFLAGIIQGSNVEAKIYSQDWRGPICNALDRHLPDADVYCHYNAHPNSISYDMPMIRETFNDGLEQVRSSDVMVAWLPSASMGTAIELCEAFRSGAIVLTISPMKTNWVVRLFSHRIFPNVEAFEQFLAEGLLETLIKRKKSAAVKA